MTSTSPQISVVMSVYNGGPSLREAVASILDQTFGDFEFLIVNDGSTDGSLEYLTSVAASDPRVRVIDQANAGLTRALITAVSEARAPIVARMDADDWSDPNRLALQLNEFRQRPELCAVSCGIEYVSSDLIRLGISERQFDPAAWPLMITLFNVIGGHGHMMFRRDAYDKVGGYQSHFRFAQDFDLWARLLRIGPMGEAPGLLFRFRVGHDSVSMRHRDRQRELAVEIATREYNQLTSMHPDAEVVGDSLDFWGWRLDAGLPLARLVALDAHFRKAFLAYATRYPDRRAAVQSARQEVARAWLQRLRVAPLHDREARRFLIRSIVRWDIGTLAVAIVRRGLRPFVTLLQRLNIKLE